MTQLLLGLFIAISASAEMTMMPNVFRCLYEEPEYKKDEIASINGYEACMSKWRATTSFIPDGKFPECDTPTAGGAANGKRRQVVGRAHLCASRITMNIPNDSIVTQCQDEMRQKAFAAIVDVCVKKATAQLELTKKNNAEVTAFMKNCESQHPLGHRLRRVEDCRKKR